MYVNDSDLFETVQVLEDTPPVLSLGKLCEAHGNSYKWIRGQKPHLSKKKKAGTFDATLNTACPSLFRACQLGLPTSGAESAS